MQCPPHHPKTWNGHISATKHPFETSQRTDLITVRDRQIMPSLAFVCTKNGEFVHCSCVICTLFTQGYWGAQTMSFPVRSLCPPSDIALECICQTALGFPASWPIIAQRCKQDSSIPWLAPRGSCKVQSQSRLKISANQTLCSMVYSGPEKVY